MVHRQRVIWHQGHESKARDREWEWRRARWRASEEEIERETERDKLNYCLLWRDVKLRIHLPTWWFVESLGHLSSLSHYTIVPVHIHTHTRAQRKTWRIGIVTCLRHDVFHYPTWLICMYTMNIWVMTHICDMSAPWHISLSILKRPNMRVTLTCIHTSTHKHSHLNGQDDYSKHTFPHTHAHTHAHTHTHTHTHTRNSESSKWLQSRRLCTIFISFVKR